MLRYIYPVEINRGILEIMNKIDASNLDTTDESTLVYYAVRLIAEMDRLERTLSGLAVSDQPRVKSLIAGIQEHLDKVNSKIHYTEYFKNLGDDHQYIHMLNDYRNSGMSLDEALRNLTIQSGTPRLQLLGFINDVNNYPTFDPTSREFSLGSDIARNDYKGTLDSMYKHLDSIHLGTDKMNDFIAGYLSVKPLSRIDSNLEELKGKLYQFSSTHEGATDIISDYDKYLRR